MHFCLARPSDILVLCSCEVWEHYGKMLKKLNSFLGFFAYFSVFLYTAGPAQATDWHVPTDSLQTAIENATDDDNIIIDAEVTSNLALTPTPFVIDKKLHYSSNPPGPYAINMYVSAVADSNRHFNFSSGASGTTFTNLALNNIMNVGLSAAISMGGAIYTDGADLTLNGVTFGGTRGNRVADAGGAIYSINGNLVINDGSRFSTSSALSATSTGGAIYIESATLEINDSVNFTTNKAALGGAIYAKDTAITLTGNTNFTSNAATGGLNLGGAIYSDGGDITIDAATFNLNTATNGAGIYITGADIDITGAASFTSNTATESGGAIYSDGDYITIGDGVYFISNKAKIGGAIYAKDVLITLNGANIFTSNAATGGLNLGGAIYSDGGDITIDTATFNLNTATNGAGIYITGADIDITGAASFTSNTATNLGGAIYSDDGDITISYGTSFTSNKAANGGAIYINSGNLDIDTATFASNTGTTAGGAIFAQGDGITMNIAGIDGNDMAIFQGNISSGNLDSVRKIGAGAIFFDGITAVTDASFDSGFDPSACALCISYTKFDSNKANASVGGAMYINNTTATILNSEFSSNTTGVNGGTMGAAIYNGPGAKTYIENTSFIGNSTIASAAYGGAIYNSGFMKLVNVTVSGNSAKTWGGAVLSGGNFNNGEAEFSPEITVIDSYFYQNLSIGGGGAFGSADNSARADVINTKFIENSAQHGGAIYNETVVNIKDSEFTNNIGTNGGTGGGAIWSGANWAIGEKLDLTVDNSTFTGNRTSSAGGAIYLNISSTTTTDPRFPDWKYPDTNTTRITNSSFNNNLTTGTGNGGAIYANVSLGGSLIQDRKLILDIDTVTFDGNSSGGNGGAIFISTEYADTANNKVGTATLTINDTDFTNNVAATNGGAIYGSMTRAGSELNITLSDVDFDSNTAGTSGGALYLSGQSATTRQNTTISNSTFDNNKVRRIAVIGASYTLSGGAINNAQNSDLIFIGNHEFNANNIDGSLTNTGTGTANFSLTMNAYGSAIYNATNSTIDFGTFVFEFNENFAESVVNATNSGTFVSTSTANAHGGAFYNSVNTTIEFNPGSVFDENSVYAEANSTNTGTGAANATANAYGGAIYNSAAGIINIQNSSIFVNNAAAAVATSTGSGTKTTNANAYGGAIYNTGTNSEINIMGLEKTGIDETRVVFRGNSVIGGAANTFGGAIYNAAKLNITYALFENNLSSGLGGAIYSANLPITFDEIEFSGNSSDVAGGALYINVAAGTFNLNNVTFTSNSSLDGGAFYSKMATNVSDTVSFTDNTATGFGGAWYINSGTVNLNAATFTGNSAATGGGAIYNNGTLNVNGGTTFANNSSTTAGGAIYTMQNLTLNSTAGNINFTNNTVAGVGNDIYINGITARTITINGTTNNVIMNGGFATNGTPNSGNHTITKTNAGNLLVTGDNFGFTGTSTISGGQAIIDGKWINGLTTVNNALLRVTSETVHERVTVANSAGIFEHLSNSLTRSDIANTNFKFSVGSGATMKFMADSSLVGQLAKYNLANNLAFTLVGTNNVLFKDSDVTFGINSYLKNSNGWINYTFQDSVINLGNAAIETTSFQQITLDNAKLSFDVGFKTDGTIDSDKIAITTLGGENTIKLGNVYSVNGQNDNGLTQVYTSQVLMPTGLNFDSSLTTTVKSDIYEYLATVSGKNVTLTVIGAADENSLYAANAQTGTRSFNMTYFTATPYTYNIGQNLGATSNGTFNVVGNSAATSIISGILVDSDGTPIGGKGSFFDVSGTTNLTLEAISIVDAYKLGDGSVLSVNGGGSTINLNSLTLANNEATANGGAIYNSGVITVTGNSSFENNIAGLNGGAIYNSGTLFLNSNTGNIVFSGNTATGDGNDIYNNSGTININGTGNDVIFNGGIAGNGTINKSGAGRLVINADVSDFNGIFAQSAGTTIFSDVMFDGNINVSGGTVEIANGGEFSNNSVLGLSSGGTLNITTGSNIILTGGNLTGLSGTYGTVNKSGAMDLILDGNNSVFRGIYNQTAGRTLVDSTSLMFNGTNNISNSILEISALTVYEKANIGNNGQLIHTAEIAITSAINDGNTNLQFIGTGGSMLFDASTSLANGTNYNLANKIDNGNSNTVTFSKSNVLLGATDYTGGTTYAFSNSTIDLNSGALNNVVFSKTKLTNAKLSFDTRFAMSGSDPVLTSDTFNAGTLSGDSTINIGIIRILNDDADTGLSGMYTSQVLSDSSSLTFGGSLDTMYLSTNVYEYEVTTNGKNVQLSVVNAADINSLYRMNDTANKRGFNISYFSGSAVYYNIGQSLGITKDGEFIVQGFDNDPEHGIISGEIVDQNGDSTDSYGSFFKLAGATIFTLKNLTIEDAYSVGSGSVLSVTGAASSALVENMILQNNESVGNGGAVYATAGELHIGQAIFDSNKSGANGGAIYNSGNTSSVGTTKFETNVAVSTGGAIYNSGTISFADLVEFISNRSVDGAAVYNTGTTGFNGVTNIQSNIATGNGALYNSGNTTFYNEVNMIANSSLNGGAVYTNGGLLSLRALANFENNNATTSGGAWYINSGTITVLDELILDSNSANAGNGGAVYVSNGGTLNINGDATISDNDALSGFGGGIYLAGNMNLGGTSATDIVFSGNSDSSGLNDVHIANTGVLSAIGSGTYSFDGGISGDTGSAISVSGAGARFSAEMTDFIGNYTQSGTLSLSQIYGILNANYTITNGVAQFIDSGLSAGKTITVNGNGIAQYLGLNSDNLGTVTGSGTLVVANTLTNTGTIDVGTLRINFDTINDGTIDSDSTIINADVTNNSAISGTGTTTIMDGANLLNLGTIQQNRLIINSGAITETIADDLTIANGITNNGTLIFNGGTNANVISGSGLLQIIDDVNNTALISIGDVEIISGKEFNSNASKISASNAIQNQGLLNLYGNGTWTSAVTGTDGTTTFGNGTLNNTATIQQKGLVVNGDGIFITDGGLIQTGDDGIIVNGTLNVTRGNLTAQTISLVSSGPSDVPTFDLRSTSVANGASTISVDSINADATSKIYMEIFSNKQNDTINVSGAALLNGELHVRVGVGTYRNVTFTLLNADSLSGDLIDDITSGNDPTLAFIDAANIIDGRYDYKYDADSNTITLFFNGINASNFKSMPNLSFNQMETGGALDIISRTAVGDITTVINDMIDLNDEAVTRSMLGELSPYFIANILRPTTDNANRTHLYGRIKEYCKDCSGNGLWIDGGMNNYNVGSDENSIGDAADTITSVSFGYDHYFPESEIVLGAFGKFAPETVTQGEHNADIQSMGGGIYFGLLRDSWDIKSFASISMNSYATSRKIYNDALNIDRVATADFGGFAADADLEFGYKFKLSDTFVLRPYAGGSVQMLSYDDFTETGADSLSMDVTGGSNMGMAARGGLGLEQKLAQMSWYLSAEYDILMSGNYIELETKFVDTDVPFLSRGADIGTGVIAVNAGIDYNITDRFNVYASANYSMGDNFDGYGARLGFRYTFCSDKNIANIPLTATRVGGPYYSTDKYKLTKSSKNAIQDIVNEYKDTAVKFVVEGHADSFGTEKSNLNISEKRAHEVAKYMLDLGISPDKIEHRGVGSSDPEASSLYPAGRGRNRRVDIMMF